MKTLKACLVILCLLHVSAVGSPQLDGATFFMGIPDKSSLRHKIYSLPSDQLFRFCPKCKKTLHYKSHGSFYNAVWANAICRSCTQLGNPAWNKGLSKETNESIAKYSEGLKRSWDIAKKNNSRTTWNAGLDNTDPRVKKNAKATQISLIKSYSEGKIKPWNKGKPFPQVAGDNSPMKRPDVRERHAKAIYRSPNIKFKCAFNIQACFLFDQINKEMGWNGLHATNNPLGEFRVPDTQYAVDFYEPHKNIVIEYYEKHHNRINQKEKDILRHQKIVHVLKCTFYIIKYYEQHLWRTTIEKEFWLQEEQDS